MAVNWALNVRFNELFLLWFIKYFFCRWVVTKCFSITPLRTQVESLILIISFHVLNMLISHLVLWHNFYDIKDLCVMHMVVLISSAEHCWLFSFKRGFRILLTVWILRIFLFLSVNWLLHLGISLCINFITVIFFW